MTAGLPGTGIGGLFYFVLVLLMPVREAVRVVQGRSSVARWKTIALHWLLLAGIIKALFGFSWLVQGGFGMLTRLELIGPYLEQQAANATAVSSGFALLFTLGLLATVTGTAAALRYIVGVRRTPVATVKA